MDAHVVGHRHDARRAVDLHRAHVDDEPVRPRRGDPVLRVRRIEVRGRVEGDRGEPRLHAVGQALGVPVHGAGDLAQRQLRVADVRPDRVDLVAHLPGRRLHRADAHPGEPRRVVARRDRPRRDRRVQLRDDRDVLRCAAELVGGDLRGDRAVALALRGRPQADGDPAERVDRHRCALDVARLRRRRGTLDGRLGKGDVPHVRDRGLDDAREPDADEPALRPAPLGPCAQLAVARRARAHGRGRRRSRPSRTARPTASGTASRRRGRGSAARARPGRSRGGGRRSSSSARARSRAGARRTRGSIPRERCWSGRPGSVRRRSGPGRRPTSDPCMR